MPIIDFTLSLAGLLLWVNWLSIHLDPLAKSQPASLAGTLRKTGPSGTRRWKFLAGLAALLLGRAWAYWQFGGESAWMPKMDLLFTALPFRADYFDSMLLFSALSFGFALGCFYLWLLLLSAANGRVTEVDPLQKAVRILLKWIEPWPGLVKLLLPLVFGALFWLAMHPVFIRLAIVPHTKSTVQLLEQSLLMGVGTYLLWKYLIAGILLLHLLNSYLYFGEHPVWSFINTTARNLLAPLRWMPLRVGRVDLLPVVGIALVFAVTEGFAHAFQPWGSNAWLQRYSPF